MGSTISEQNNKVSPSRILPVLGFALILCYVMYGVVMHELPNDMSDYNGHVYVYITTFTGFSPIEGWKMAPYFLWHVFVLIFYKLCRIPLDVSAGITSCLFLLASYFITVFMIERWNDHYEHGLNITCSSFIAFTLTILQPVWIDYLDLGSSRLLGSFSINPLFNPTHMAARPFALLSFMLIIDLWKYQESDKTEPVFFRMSEKKIRILLALILVLSALAKPVFAEMFIPAVGLIMLAKQFGAVREKKGMQYFKRALLPTFLVALPCLLIILVEFSAYFLFGGSYGGGEGMIITGWLEVWSAFSENIPLSILFSMSFPILVIIADSKNFVKEPMGILGIVSYAVGFLEAALLGEGGDKLMHGDFIWPMLFGMLLLWASALLHFLNMEKRASSKPARFIIILGWILILIHLHYGIIYIADVLGWDFMIF